MKKEDISGIIVYLIILAFAVIFGITVLEKHIGDSYIHTQYNNIGYMIFMLIAILLGVVVNATLYELGHMVGAKSGGYDVVYVDILGVCFYKEEGKYKVKFKGFEGLTGETKIFPKENYKDSEGNPKEPTPYGYLWFGSLFIILELIVVMILFVVFQSGDKTSILADIAYFILTMGMIGVMILVYNILPFKLDTPTDGYKLTLVSNPKNKIAFNELLKVQKAIENGEDIEIPTFEEITNFTADLNLNKVYKLLENHQYEEAEKLIDMIVEAKDQINDKVYIRARAQKIYINIMKNDLETAKVYYEQNVPVSEKREISEDVSMPSIRAYLLMAGLLDKSKSECKIVLANVMRAYKSTPKNRQHIEIELFNESLQKVIDAHPKWGLSDYILTVSDEKSDKK